MLYANGYPVGGGGSGGTGGHTIIDENGNSMTARAGLQFVGGANVEDDGTNNKTIVDLASAGGIDGVFIDTSNVIQTSTPITSSADVSYTATEDCVILFAIASDSNNSANIKINDIVIWEQFDTNGINQFSNYLFAKKGQTIKFHHTFTGSSGSYTVYGIQTGTTHSKFQPVIYSLEEREIGVWEDGKPIYQKSFHLTSAAVSYNSWGSTNIDSSDFDTIISAFGISGDKAFQGEMMAWNDNGTLKLQTGRNGNTAYADTLILQYTKISDVAGSGSWTPQGVPTHHYSTDEQVIGTWISRAGNEVPLYEKTFRLGSGSSTGSTTLDENLLSNLGIAEITDGYIYVWDNNVEERIILKYNTNTKKITSIPSGSHYYTHVTVQYTKAI